MNDTSGKDQGEMDLVFPAELVAEAIRSGSYKNSANALAEIVDNSYDAKASVIHVALIHNAGPSTQPHTIAVLDNGLGMDEEALRHCIQYGRHQSHGTDRVRIGKFGVGLLSASFNQCKDLEVFSWNNGLGKEVNSTKINVKKCASSLPQIVAKPLPDFFNDAFAEFDRELTDLDTHGTLVVWRELDKLTWKKAETLLDHLQKEVGRIYRKFLSEDCEEDKKLKIVISIIEQAETRYTLKQENCNKVEPVDPLFLSHWDCIGLNKYLQDLDLVIANPEKYGMNKDDEEKIKLAREQESLFIPFDFENENDNAIGEDGKIDPATYSVKGDDGKVLGQYRIIASFRRPQVVRAAAEAGAIAVRGGGSLRNPGGTSYGTLAERLRGVSIMRGGREITLDTNWLRADLTIDRWVSLSLDFDPSLDAIFGVSNDKQQAKLLSSLAQVKIDSDIEDDFNKDVLAAADRIHKILSKMRHLVGSMDSLQQMNVTDGKQTTDPASETLQVLRDISGKLDKRYKDDPESEVIGIDDTKLALNKLKQIYKGAIYDNQPASKVRPQVLIDNDLKVDVVSDPITGGLYMFTPTNNVSGAMVVRLNAKHPLFQTLQHILLPEDDASDNTMPDAQKLQEKLDLTFSSIRRLIIAFSRAELEASSQKEKDHYDKIRREWSIIARDLIGITMNDLPIDRVQQLFSQAKNRIVIVSAFIGTQALSSLLSVVPASVSKNIYVRWRLQDIYSRATDPEIFEIAKQHSAILMYHNDLHAKAYIADDKAFIGSANATRLGLGMLPRSNLELLALYDASSPEVEELLSALENEAKLAKQMPLDYMEKIDDREFTFAHRRKAKP